MTQKTFADSFSRVLNSLTNATGDQHTAWLASLSISSGIPLLVDSRTSQVKLARAMASAIKGSCESLGLGFETLNANVLYLGDLDTTHCMPAGCLRLASVAAGTSQTKTGKVVVIVGHISPPHTRKSMPTASMLEQFGFFTTVNFDGSNVGTAEAAVDLQEVAEMRDYVRNNVKADETIIAGMRTLENATTPGDDDNIPPELKDYVVSGPSSRTWTHLLALARVVAASQGRNDVQWSDVTQLLEPVLAHRYLNSGISPYNRFDLGRRIVKAVQAQL